MEALGVTMEEEKMIKTPPDRPGITFEVGARLEAQDYLQKWYPSKIEKMDYEQGKMLVHFERWSSRYDEWIHWDSSRIRPLERPSLRKEGLRDDEENCDFNEGEEVLARWTDCRYYPAKIEAINKEGTYTVQFYDGVIRCLKKMHIKSMPEDAKGQDWIALVKAAAAAAKNKPSMKPRTSVNSNKDKEERKMHRMSMKKEDMSISRPLELLHKEEEPTSSQNLEPEIALGEVTKVPTQPKDEDLLLKRKMSQASSFQAKRARLNQITGFLASKAVVLDNAEKKSQVTQKPSKLQEASAPKPQTQNQSQCRSGMTPTPLSPPMSSRKGRGRKDKQELGDLSGCKKSPLPNTDPQLKQGTPHNATLSRSTRRNNRRRSRRLTPAASSDLPRPPFKDGKGLASYNPATPDRSAVQVPDVALLPQETLEPLDLSCNMAITTPVGLGTTFHTERTTKEKEHSPLITYSPKAPADARIAPTSSAPAPSADPPQPGLTLPNNLKPPKASKKKKSPAVMNTEGAEKPIPAAAEKLPENLQEKIIKKVNEKEKHPEAGITKTEKKGKTEEKSSSSSSSSGKKKDKDKERKEKKDKDPSKSKQKKKKKKKKKSKHEAPDNVEGALNVLEQTSSPVSLSTPSAVTLDNTPAVKNTSFQFPRAILSVDLTGENLSDMEFLDDSSTESLNLSGDEYNLEFDSTNFEESQDEEEAISEIVRCVCEMDEENGFMIQCEECLCWQHSACMGLVEDSIPEQYVCYVCSDPPGQRWSARYKYDKDWYNSGRMCGLSFIDENYSYVNTKKIVSTHHLLGDVYGVTEILHGLQLKFGILNDKDHPDLRFWACPMKLRESGQVNDKRSMLSSNDRAACRHNHKGPASSPSRNEETYITSEHSYQKPQSSDQGGKPSSDGRILPGQNANFQADTKKSLQDVSEKRNERVVVEEMSSDRRSEEQLDSHLQWQLNLLTHIESVQNEVTSRMDLIEKEVDVLESWLDFTGELEPPDPLARLPQLKRRIKQLLTDMGKVQQIAALCSV